MNKRFAFAPAVGAGLLGSLALAGQASAEVPAAVTTAISGAAADIAILGGAVLVVIVGYKVFQWLRRAM